MSKGNGVTVDSHLPYERPVERSRWEQIKLAIYNPSTHEVLGRTGKSWGGLAIFYTIFYIILAAFFAICMKGLFYTLDDTAPHFTLDSSLIGNSPGLGFRPGPGSPKEGGSIIWYQADNETNVKTWTDRIDEFLKVYEDTNHLGKDTKQTVCDWNTVNDNGVCVVNVDNWGPCSRANGYGYRQSSPCVFIKLNRIFDWEPEVYNNPDDLHPDMPDYLKEAIRKAPNNTRNQVWLTCDGELPVDKEHIGPISFFPMRGFPAYYFPYRNQKGYLSPVVAVHFERPAVNVLINIECRAWAKNIRYRRHNMYREGSVHFELLIDTIAGVSQPSSKIVTDAKPPNSL